MKKIFLKIVLLAILTNSQLAAQSLKYCLYSNGSFTAPVPYTPSDIVSDFGTRNAGKPGASRFHRGIDLNPLPKQVQNKVLLAPFDATISFIVSNGLKIINIKPDTSSVSFSFLHIFNNDGLPITKNGFTLIAEGGGTIIDLVNGIAYSETPNLNISHKGINYITQNTIKKDAPMAPMGTSSNSKTRPADYHVHVSKLESGNDASSHTESVDAMGDTLINTNIESLIDTLDVRLRNRKPTEPRDLNQCEEQTTKGTWGGFTPTYTDKTRNIIETEVSMRGAIQVPNEKSRYQNGFMNESRIDIRIKTDNPQSTFSHIVTANGVSKFIINPIGTVTTYPASIGDGRYGNLSANDAGCIPYAYADNISFHPHDYYIQPDFYTRIHKDDIPSQGEVFLADFPDNARYNDGKYEIEARVTTVTDKEGWDTYYFTLDNFKPYISSVEVLRKDNGAYIYESRCGTLDKAEQNDDGKLYLNISPYPVGNLVYGVVIKAKASEPMKELNATINVGGQDVSGISTNPDGMGMNWEIRFNNSYFTKPYCYNIVFRGKDQSNNQLLNLISLLPKDATARIPKRISDTAWDIPFPEGSDNTHTFCIDDCRIHYAGNGEGSRRSPDCLHLDDVTVSQHDCSAAGQSDGEATLQVNGNTNNMVFRWWNKTGDTLSTTPQLVGVGAGTYCYLIAEQCCLFEGCVTIGECQLQVDFVLTEPTTSGDTNGSIEASVTGGANPYTYEWGNVLNNSSNTLTNVGVGVYQVTVKDANHCVYTGTVKLSSCDKKNIVIENSGFIVSPPSTCESEDGYIRVVAGINASGGTPPYTLQWQDEEGTPLENEEYFSFYLGLINATYYLEATDAHGCKGKLAVPVRREWCWGIAPTEIHASCFGNPNGFIQVFATENATWTWSNGVVLQGEDVTLNNLTAGTYSVTVTFNSYEPIIQSFEVPDIQISTPIFVQGTVTPNCPGKQNGKINLALAGGISPYASVLWSDLPNQSTWNRDNLAAGTYVVTVTDYCGSTATASFTLTPLSVSVSMQPGCRNQGTMTATVSGGVPPYTYLWDTGATTATATGLRQGGHSVTVKDAAGCIFGTPIKRISNKEYGLTEYPPCVGFQDGKVVLNISNPLLEAVSVVLTLPANVSVNVPPVDYYMNVPIDNLTAEVTYAVNVTIGNCVYTNEQFKLKATPTDKVLSDYNSEKLICTYDEFCKGVKIGDNTYFEKAKIRNDESSNMFGGCSSPIYCGKEKKGELKYAYQTVKVYKYLIILQQAYYQGLINAAQYSTFSEGLGKPCNRVTYCPASFEVVGHINVDGAGYGQNLGNGCYHLECTGWLEDIFDWVKNEKEDFCLKDILPNYVINSGTTPNDCDIRSYNVLQLLLWFDQMNDPTNADFIKFRTNNVGNYLKPFLEHVRETESLMNNAACTSVIFCKNDFSILYSDVATNECYYSYEPPCDGPGIPRIICLSQPLNGDDPLFTQTFCPHPVIGTNCGFETGVLINELPQYNKFRGNGNGNNDSLGVQWISNLDKNSYYVRAGVLKSKQLELPKPIFQDAAHHRFSYDYVSGDSESLQKVTKSPIPKVEFYIYDLKKNEVDFVQTVEEGKQYLVLKRDSSAVEWSKPFFATQSLNISHFSKDSSGMNIGGTFKGNLTFNNFLLESAENNSGFLIKVGFDGTLLSQHIIRGISPDSKVIFSQNVDGDILINAKPKGNELYIDGNLVSTDEGKYLTLTQKVETAAISQSGGDFAFGNKFNLIHATYSADGKNKVQVIRGVGSITKSGEPFFTTDTEKIICITTDDNGKFLWSKSFDATNISKNDFDITFGANGNLFVGLTFSNTLQIADTAVLQSTGGSDIALLNLGNDGSLLGYKTYGTSDDEKIMQLHYNLGLLYFGGEFSGNIKNRTIGKNKFFNLSEASNNAYMSFVPESDLNSSNLQERRKQNLTKNLIPEATKAISIRPNPFSNELIIEIKAVKIEKVVIELLNVLGKAVWKQEQNLISGKNEIIARPPSQLPPGVYYLEVKDEKGNFSTQKIIKIENNR